MIAVQSDTGLNPKLHHPQSRAPSPVPSAVLPGDVALPDNSSLPRLPLPRRSSFSTETEQYETKPLVTQRSFPHLTSRKHHHFSSNKRRESDATTTDDNIGSDGSISANASAESLTKEICFANDKRNNDFHSLFRSVPDQERLIDDYGCALQKEILLQGRVYISEHHLCFNANIFGWITNLVIAFADIEDIEKRSTAIFIPNAILISTCSSKHFLASFLSRDQAFDQMVGIWKASRASTSSIEILHIKSDDMTVFSEDDESDYSSSGYSSSEEEDVDTEMINSNISHDKNQSTIQDRQASLASLPLPKHLTAADEAARRRAVSEAGPRPNMQDYLKKKKSAEPVANNDASNDAAAIAQQQNTQIPVPISEKKPEIQVKEKTECDCSKNDQHFPTVVMDNTYNTTIETMYNILYDSSFMNKFLSEVEKSTEVCIGEWSNNNGGCVSSRETSYIKYLGGSIGPKTTKCYSKEDILHLDTSNYISQLTVTQTPDVPSGGSFSVKTRTCISWCGQGQVRVLVTMLVDFTKSSWLKSTIEKASVDGQQNFYKSLDAAVRKYLITLGGESKRNTQGKKKGARRKHRHRQHHNQETQAGVIAASTEKKQHVIIEAVLNILNWLISNVSMPSTSQLTAICMALMVLTNLYIASKMAGVNKQINQLSRGGNIHHLTNSLYRHHPYDLNDNDNNNENSLWSLLSKLDPDARKEDLRFVHQIREPITPDDAMKYQNHNTNNQDSADEQLELSKLAKTKLDRKMMELERMIQKAGQSMEQVTQVVQSQRQRILNPDWQ